MHWIDGIHRYHKLARILDLERKFMRRDPTHACQFLATIGSESLISSLDLVFHITLEQPLRWG